MSNDRISPVVWVAIYLLLVTGPVLALFAGRMPQGSGFWWDFSMALGFAGMAMMGVQFVLTARFRRSFAPFGIDIIYYFHRYLAVIGFFAIVVHAVIALWSHPGALAWLDPRIAPWYMNAGIAAFVLTLLIVVTSIWRKQIRFEYDLWRFCHAVLAVGAFALALAHIEGVGYFINDPLQRLLWTAATLGWLLLLVHVRIVRPLRLARMPYRVREVRKEAGRVWTLALQPVGHAGIAFSPGQFAWISIGYSPFRMKEHPFSISSVPSGDGTLEFTIKELGDFTRTIGRTPPGTTVYVDGPYGIFTTELVADAPGIAFIAGGVGIAPIISILRSLAERGERRPLALVFCNRIEEHILFRTELDELARKANLKVVHVLSEPSQNWNGERGFISRDVLTRHLHGGFTDFAYFICGPNPMIRAAERSLGTLGVPMRNLHSEVFDLA